MKIKIKQAIFNYIYSSVYNYNASCLYLIKSLSLASNINVVNKTKSMLKMCLII